MAYRLKPGRETVEAGTRRIAGEEFARIADILADSELPLANQVHEVRKSTKRIRSVIRLVAPVFPAAKAENTILKDCARSLSSARDTGAIHDSLGRLKLPAETREATNAALVANPTASGSAAGSVKLLKVFGRDIRAAAKRAAFWNIASEGFDAVRPGVQRSYKRLRKDFAAAISTRDEEATHNWRKSAKSHWHQTLLLGQICPEAMDAHAKLASRLSECLGDWRDSGLLIAALEALPPDALHKDALKDVKRAALRDQKRLLKKAERISGLLTAEKPKALIARWAVYWSLSDA
ncbi:CHAD domain protein [Hyphomonas neptunium ATCC 15444]|uniref:CHAD domain protein n=1 Tax=Hyphomonas neptunium (strain ATCC 15444) TaxID=228405 RepID=Q0C5T2_HYPNA|nr:MULTISPECIES: CHAD domain-containing protein [Hyphomonas]ABI77229.1 CHAD domain protein [Hyphomonas neptunium ATCC 15444]